MTVAGLKSTTSRDSEDTLSGTTGDESLLQQYQSMSVEEVVLSLPKSHNRPRINPPNEAKSPCVKGVLYVAKREGTMAVRMQMQSFSAIIHCVHP